MFPFAIRAAFQPVDVGPFVVTADGVVWFMTESDPISFLGFDGTDWQVVPAPAGYPGDMSGTGTVGVAPDGGTWWTAADSFVQHQSLTRLDEEGWTTFSAADGVGTWGGQRGEWSMPTAMLKVAPDGSAWVNATRANGAGTTRTSGLGIRTCDGVARFDGDAWQPFLAGTCISDLDFTPDGSAWVVALDRASREVSTYVITPEAVAASE